MEKLENKNLEKEIINLYESGVSKRKISKQINVSTSYIDRIVLEYKIPKRTFVANENFKIVAKCKKTNKIFDDFENKSGILTNHVLKTYNNFVLPSSFKRRKYFKENNKFWFEEFFDIIQIKEESKKTRNCNYCNWETNDINNNSGCYTTHLNKEHNKTVEEYLNEFPEEKDIFKTFFLKNERKKFINSSEKNQIECNICKEKFLKITNSHLKKHNISLIDYKIKFKDTLSENSLIKFQSIYLKNLKNLPSKFISKPQNEIIVFLKSIGIDKIDINNKSILDGVELDIFINDYNLAIEFNGIYYHSELSGKKDKNYHKNKLDLCFKKNIRLINIFEDEWQNKKEIIKNKLQHLVFKNKSPKIHARKTVIRHVSKQEKENFLNKNHIQGNDESNIFLGAYYNNVLCAVMTFDNKRTMNKEKNHNDTIYELKRFATKNDLIISGIASKILKFFIKNYNPKKIISFADLRWTIDINNNLYVNLNFKLQETIKPDYSYTFYKSGIAYRFHKFGFGKKSIKSKFPEIYDESKTEWQMMQEKGFDRIWDCGKLKYVLEF